MKYIIVRDDDISHFTQPDTIDLVYGDALRDGVPVTFAAIPAVASDTRYGPGGLPSIYYDREGVTRSVLVPPGVRGQARTWSIVAGDPVVSYLKQFPQVEILQHGLTHGAVDGVYEFALQDRAQLQDRSAEGCRILEEAFGRRPAWFVAPFDQLSHTALDVLGSRYDGVSVYRLPRLRQALVKWKRHALAGHPIAGMDALRTVPLAWQVQQRQQAYAQIGRAVVIEHPGYLVSRFYPEDMVETVLHAVNTHAVTVLVNHHWEFTYDWGRPDQALLAPWRRVMECLRGRRDVTFTTFHQWAQQCAVRRSSTNGGVAA